MSLHVPPEAIAGLPLERRLTLLDAESDRLAAIDLHDAQEETALAAEDSLRAAKARLKKAEATLDRLADEKKPLDVGEAVVAEAKARIEFAEQDLDLQRAKLRTAAAALLVSEAFYERTRAGEVDAAGLAGAYDVKKEKYETQVADLEANAAEKASEETEQKKLADEAQKTWQAARAKVAKLTGGAQGSVWVD